MSKLNIWRTPLLLCLGLAVTLALTFLIGLLLKMRAARPPDVAQAQVSPTIGEANPSVPLEIRNNGDTDETYSIDYIRVASIMLTVTKQANPDPVQAGSLLTYTIRVTNTGNTTLTATITDILPRQVAPACIIIWTPNPVAPGGVWTQQVSVTVETGYSGTLVNVVQLTTDKGVTGIYTETSIAQAQAPFTTVVVTPTAISHALSGVGVHMFDSDHDNPNFTRTLDALGLKYLRVPFGPEWNELDKEPPACDDKEYEEHFPSMYKFVRENFNGDYTDRLTKAISISNIAEGKDIEIIFLNWRAHEKWLTDLTYKELKEDYVDDYACFVTAIVRFLADNGVKISYLEPTNEPSDTHDTKIPPERYNTFVKFLRKYLDVEGLSEVGILGPGLAYLNHGDTCKAYVEALDDDGVDAISVWSSHAWDPVFSPNEPEAGILRMKCEEFRKCVRERERPDQPKPFFITEYACVNDPANEICAVENTLTLLDCGANVVVYWYLREQYWDTDPANRDRAPLTKNYDEKPTFIAFTSVLPYISGDEVGVSETYTEGRITSASFYKADNELGEIIVVLVNSYPESENVLIDTTEFYTIGASNGGVVYSGNTQTITKGWGLCQADDRCDRTRCELSLQKKSIATLVRPPIYFPIIMRQFDGG